MQGIFRLGGNLQRVQQAVEELEDLKTLKFNEVRAVRYFDTNLWLGTGLSRWNAFPYPPFADKCYINCIDSSIQ